MADDLVGFLYAVYAKVGASSQMAAALTAVIPSDMIANPEYKGPTPGKAAVAKGYSAIMAMNHYNTMESLGMAIEWWSNANRLLPNDEREAKEGLDYLVQELSVLQRRDSDLNGTIDAKANIATIIKASAPIIKQSLNGKQGTNGNGQSQTYAIGTASHNGRAPIHQNGNGDKHTISTEYLKELFRLYAALKPNLNGGLLEAQEAYRQILDSLQTLSVYTEGGNIYRKAEERLLVNVDILSGILSGASKGLLQAAGQHELK